MKPVFSFLALFGALFMASCDDSASVPSANPAAHSESQVDLAGPDMPSVGFAWISFRRQGGFTGNGNGESLTLTSGGRLTRVAAKPLETDSGPQWSGRYDTTALWIRGADLLHVDSVLHSGPVLSPAPLPDSAFDSCRPIFDGSYWTAGVLWQGQDIVDSWRTSPMGCFDGNGATVPTPVSEGVVVLQALEQYLMTVYFPSDSAEK